MNRKGLQPPKKNFYKEGTQGPVEKACTHPQPQPPSEEQKATIKAVVLYSALRKGTRLHPSKNVWVNKDLAGAWLGEQQFPTWGILRSFLAKVGQERIDMECQKLGLPQEPRLSVSG